MKKWLKEIVKNINTQNNRITADPLFAVQKKVRVYGFEAEYCDNYEWIDGDDSELSELEDRELEELDAKGENGEDTAPYYKCYYKESWEFVTACFTEKGCQDYITGNSHNLGETRIYAYSGYRNDEFCNLREYLKTIGDPS